MTAMHSTEKTVKRPLSQPKRVRLSDKSVATLRPRSERYSVYDQHLPCFGLRISPDGQKRWFVLTRLGSLDGKPQRFTLGRADLLPVLEAREAARELLRQLARGEDPRAEQRKAKDQTFGLVFAQYEKELAKQRRGHKVVQLIRRTMLPTWDKRPVATITPRDILSIIDEAGASKRVTSGRTKHLTFNAARGLFRFAKSHHLLDQNPCDAIDRRALGGGNANVRTRTLSDDELFALWRTAKRLPYPWGPFYQLLVLTGCRRDEVAGMRRCEVDLRNQTWVIRGARHKSQQDHSVPLTGEMLQVLGALPRWSRSELLFSTNGLSPLTNFSDIKTAVDRRMLRTLRALARRRGENPDKVTLPGWQNHDLRRVVRSHLAALHLPDHICELSVGHARKGIARVYDQHRYASEIRDALTAWNKRLMNIVEPKEGDNIVPLMQAAG